MIERHEFEPPALPGPEASNAAEREAALARYRRWLRVWVGWLAEHTIFPDHLVTDGWVERDEERRQVRYLALKGAWVDEDGRLHCELSGEPPRREPVVEVRTVQLESVPSPFPDVPARPPGPRRAPPGQLVHRWP